MSATDFDIVNVGGFTKVINNDINIISFHGPLFTITVRGIEPDTFIQVLDTDTRLLDDKLTNSERINSTVDYKNLIDKKGTTTAVEYVELLINNGEFETGNSQILEDWNNEGVPLRSQQGISFGISSRENNILSGINTGDDECAYLFRAKAGSGGVSLRSFFLSFESTTNDEYEIRFSVNPTFSNHTFIDSNFSTGPIVQPTNPIQSKLEVAIAGELGVPGDPLINGYDQANGGRFLLGKRALGRETVDSRLLFELFIPEGATFAVSILATGNGAAVNASANWNE